MRRVRRAVQFVICDRDALTDPQYVVELRSRFAAGRRFARLRAAAARFDDRFRVDRKFHLLIAHLDGEPVAPDVDDCAASDFHVLGKRVRCRPANHREDRECDAEKHPLHLSLLPTTIPSQISMFDNTSGCF